MEIPLFLAMTAAEFQGAEMLPAHPAWMACHFSLYETGISNVPRALPKGAMLMLNDRTPISGHDPKLVAQTLCNAATKLECECIALDFQRQNRQELTAVVDAVLGLARCPVGVSALYAGDFDCPVLLPPIPPHVWPADAVALWKGRELWLEVTTEGTEITVTAAGSQYTPLPHYRPDCNTHREPKLHCHYEISVSEDAVLFQLGRTGEDQTALLNALSSLGITHALGLWQEIKE